MARSVASFQDLPPHILYKIFMLDSLSARDLVNVEVTCYAFRAPSGLQPLRFKSILEIAAVDRCKLHPLYATMTPIHQMQLLRKCHYKWKMLLRYLQATGYANGSVPNEKGKVQVAAGKYHSVVLVGNKGIFACGSGLPYMASDQMVSYESFGLFVPVPMPQNVVVSQVSTSHQHVAFITTNGELYTYGDNKSGCCGHGEANIHGITLDEVNRYVLEPMLVITLKDARCKQVSAGVNFTIVLTEEGHAYACGKNTHGQLGLGDTMSRDTFSKIDMHDFRAVQVSAGAAHALMVTDDGSVFSWGYGANSCLGCYDVANKTRPWLIQTFKDNNIFLIGISAGYEHSVALDCNGQVYTWGRGYCGALGHGHESDVQIPQKVTGLDEIRAIQVCARKRRTFVLTDDGELYGFGWMGFGSLGLSNKWSSEKVISPSVLDSLRDHKICQVSAGLYHTLVVTSKGTVLGFGDNDKGPLGPRLGSCPEPIEVVSLHDLETSHTHTDEIVSSHLSSG